MSRSLPRQEAAPTFEDDVERLLSKPSSIDGRLQRFALALLREHEHEGMLPTNGRFVWYELVQRGVVDKTKARGHPGVKRGIDQELTEALTHLRQCELVPWSWIEDETRSLDEFIGHASIRAGVAALLDGVRLDPWGGQPPPLIITESRALVGVLRALADEYCCDIASTNGQAAGFLHTRVGPALGPDRLVFYLGDLDLSGGQIEGNTRTILEGYQPGLQWERLALTQEQVTTYDLADLAIWKTDGRYKSTGLHRAIETEALGQANIIAIVRARLDQLLPEPLGDVRVREVEDRAAFRERMEGWR